MARERSYRVLAEGGPSMGESYKRRFKTVVSVQTDDAQFDCAVLIREDKGQIRICTCVRNGGGPWSRARQQWQILVIDRPRIRKMGVRS